MNNSSAIAVLKAHLGELRKIQAFGSVEEKARHIGEMNRIDSSIQLLELCEQHSIIPGALVNALPESENIHFQYLVAHENESSNPENWQEVIFDGQQIRLSGGDLIIRM